MKSWRGLGSLNFMRTVAADWWLYYLNELPDYYITKAEAYEMGWNNLKGNLAEVAPNHMIFGGVYKNKKKFFQLRKAGFGMKLI